MAFSGFAQAWLPFPSIPFRVGLDGHFGNTLKHVFWIEHLREASFSLLCHPETVGEGSACVALAIEDKILRSAQNDNG